MGNPVEIRAPSEQTEGTQIQVLRWLKAVGEAVAENEPLIELETDKVTVEVAAPRSGVLAQILKRERDEIEPGDLLGLIDEMSGAVQRHASTSAVGHEDPATGSPTSAEEARRAMGEAALSPAVRRLLGEHGLQAAAIRGSGEGGRITVDDVLRHAAARGSAGQHAPAAPSQDETLDDEAAVKPEEGRVRKVPHTAMRRRIAAHMVQSLLRTAPHVTSVFDADMSSVLAHRAQHRQRFERHGAPLTLTVYFLAAAVDAIRAAPQANSRWTDEAIEIFEDIHIGIATALADQGLVVPVMRHVQSRDLADIARGLHDLVTRARSGRLVPADVRGGTVTLSNHGVSGSLLATPIVIHQPQTAILGIGRLEKRAVVVMQDGEDRIVVRPKCYVTLTIDHRVMDGRQADRFLQAFVRRLEFWPIA